MKKAAILIIALMLLSACGAAESDVSGQEERQKVSANATFKTDKGDTSAKPPNEEPEEDTEQEVAPAAERTIELENDDDPPWWIASPEELKAWVDDGEVVYLWSDAEGIENLVFETINTEYPEDIIDNPEERRENANTSSRDYINVFIDELAPQYPDKKEYFDTIGQAADALGSGDYDTAKAKVKEAKTLRESQ